jgi:hypothetical protein
MSWRLKQYGLEKLKTAERSKGINSNVTQRDVKRSGIYDCEIGLKARHIQLGPYQTTHDLITKSVKMLLLGYYLGWGFSS